LVLAADYFLSIRSLADKNNLLKCICQLSKHYLVIQITDGEIPLSLVTYKKIITWSLIVTP